MIGAQEGEWRYSTCGSDDSGNMCSSMKPIGLYLLPPLCILPRSSLACGPNEARFTISPADRSKTHAVPFEQLISDCRGVSKVAIQPRGGRRVCKTKSLPSQWHKLRLRLCYITSFPHRRGIPAEFLSKLHLSGISTTKLHTQQERACCGTGDRNIRRGATLTLDPVDQLIRPVTFMRVRGSGYRSDGSKVKV